MACLNLLKKFKYYNFSIELEFFFKVHNYFIIVALSIIMRTVVYTTQCTLQPPYECYFSGFFIRWCAVQISFE